nr:MAG TPA: hypothetical protein [Caudoviricetes sp.]DAY12889.1 MAG TPA: hypothetical protein [Caudoviricetes sp.]
MMIKDALPILGKAIKKRRGARRTSAYVPS